MAPIGNEMLDKPDKTARLVAILKAAVPFEVELPASTLARLRECSPDMSIAAKEIVLEVTYELTYGGIICHIRPDGTDDLVATSLTHVRIHPVSAIRSGSNGLPEASPQETAQASTTAFPANTQPSHRMNTAERFSAIYDLRSNDHGTGDVSSVQADSLDHVEMMLGTEFDKPGDGAFDFVFGEETGLAQFVRDFGSDRMHRSCRGCAPRSTSGGVLV